MNDFYKMTYGLDYVEDMNWTAASASYPVKTSFDINELIALATGATNSEI